MGPEAKSVVCPDCQSTNVTRSHRRNEVERLMASTALPYRCKKCGRRFFDRNGGPEVRERNAVRRLTITGIAVVALAIALWSIRAAFPALMETVWPPVENAVQSETWLISFFLAALGVCGIIVAAILYSMRKRSLDGMNHRLRKMESFVRTRETEPAIDVAEIRAELQRTSAEHRASVEGIRGEITAADGRQRAEIDRLRGELASLGEQHRSELDRITAELSAGRGLRDEIDIIRAELVALAELRATINRVSAELAIIGEGQRSEMERLQNEFTGSAARQAAEVERLATEFAAYAELRPALARVETQLAATEELRSAIDGALAELAAASNGHRAAIEQVSAALTSSANGVTSDTDAPLDAAGALRSAIERINGKLTASHRVRSGQIERINRELTAIKWLRSEVERLTTEVAAANELRAHVERLNSEVASLRAELAQAREEVRSHPVEFETAPAPQPEAPVPAADEELFDPVRETHLEGLEAFRAGNVNTAEGLFRRALALCEERSESALSRGVIQYDLARVLARQGDADPQCRTERYTGAIDELRASLAATNGEIEFRFLADLEDGGAFHQLAEQPEFDASIMDLMSGIQVA